MRWIYGLIGLRYLMRRICIVILGCLLRWICLVPIDPWSFKQWKQRFPIYGYAGEVSHPVPTCSFLLMEDFLSSLLFLNHLNFLVPSLANQKLSSHRQTWQKRCFVLWRGVVVTFVVPVHVWPIVPCPYTHPPTVNIRAARSVFSLAFTQGRYPPV